jgi:hypothetical protein
MSEFCVLSEMGLEDTVRFGRDVSVSKTTRDMQYVGRLKSELPGLAAFFSFSGGINFIYSLLVTQISRCLWITFAMAAI